MREREIQRVRTGKVDGDIYYLSIIYQYLYRSSVNYLSTIYHISSINYLSIIFLSSISICLYHYLAIKIMTESGGERGRGRNAGFAGEDRP